MFLNKNMVYNRRGLPWTIIRSSVDVVHGWTIIKSSIDDDKKSVDDSTVHTMDGRMCNT